MTSGLAKYSEIANDIANDYSAQFPGTCRAEAVASIVDARLRAAGLLKEQEPQVPPGPWIEGMGVGNYTVHVGANRIIVLGPDYRAITSSLLLHPEMVAVCEAAHLALKSIATIGFHTTDFAPLKMALIAFDQRRAGVEK